MTVPQRETMQLPDGEVSVLEWPAEGPRLLFSHATGFNAETYRSLLQPLSDKIHVLAPDARGHGFTSLPAIAGMAKNWTIYRDDLVRFLDGLDGKPIILAGHSMGATVSVLTALLRPHLVRGLVLIEPVFAPAQSLGRKIMSALPFKQRIPDMAERASRRRDTFESFDAAFDSYKGRGAFKTWPDEILRDYLKGGLFPAGEGRVRLACVPAWEAQTFASAPYGITSMVQRLQCPVTILYAGESNTCPDSEAARFRRNHKGTRRVRVNKASHFLPMEYPDITRDEILRMAKMLDVEENVKIRR